MDCYYSGEKNCEEIERDEEWFESLSEEQQQIEKEKSWNRIFNINEDNQYVQATFWEIRIEMVKQVKYFDVDKEMTQAG